MPGLVLKGVTYVIDGHHTLQAYIDLHRHEVPCRGGIPKVLTLDQAFDLSVAGNTSHGVPWTPEQRKELAIKLRKRNKNRSTRDIAKLVGAHYSTVSLWIKSVENSTPRSKLSGEGGSGDLSESLKEPKKVITLPDDAPPNAEQLDDGLNKKVREFAHLAQSQAERAIQSVRLRPPLYFCIDNCIAFEALNIRR